MSTQLAPKKATTPNTAEYDQRVLFLSGFWRKPGSEFGLRATIYIDKDGTCDGAIYFRAYKSGGKPVSYFATEAVHGCVRGLELELEGHFVEEGLAPDSYKIVLSDGEEGQFGGTSRAHGDWSGKLDGTFVFRNRQT